MHRILIALLTVAATSGIVTGGATANLTPSKPDLPFDGTPEGFVKLMEQITGRDHTGATVRTMEVPQGMQLAGHATPDGDFVLGAVPASASNIADACSLLYGSPPEDGCHPGEVADCTNPQVDYWWYTAYPVSDTGVPDVYVDPNTGNVQTQGTNIAPDCPYQRQHGPITLFQFRTVGDYWGITAAYDYASGSLFEVGCAPAGTSYGAGVGNQWVTTFKDVGLICVVVEYGLNPSEFSNWDAYVYNLGFFAQTVYAAYA